MDANLVFPESRDEHVSPGSVFAGPHFGSAGKFPLGFIAGFHRSWHVFLFERRERLGKHFNDS